MKETGLMFKAPLVRAIFSGQKTQTRRIVKPQPAPHQGMVNAAYCGKRHLWLRDGRCEESDPAYEWRCPMGQPGDRLWVRETWRGVVNIAPPGHYEYAVARYVPDREQCRRLEYAATQERDGEPWRPSMHMPRWASRITLEIIRVRVERLQQITDADSLAEGVDRTNTSIPGYARERFKTIWESTGGDWAANPWVWVIDFKRIERL